MPFNSNDTGAFNKAAIEALGPNQMGVYGIYRGGQWIYIGAGDVRERLLSHLEGANSADACIQAREPASWIAEMTSSYQGREGVLIREFKPPCNQLAG